MDGISGPVPGPDNSEPTGELEKSPFADNECRSGLVLPSETIETGPMRRRFGSFSSYSMSKIPIIIPTFNNPSYAGQMIEQLRRFGLHNIVILDNNSQSDDMIAFLDEVRDTVTVIDLPDNRGPHYVFTCPDSYACLPDVFCVTDPDLRFGTSMPLDFLGQLFFLTNRLEIGKAGLALDISERDTMSPDKITVLQQDYHIWEWEEKFWRECVGVIDDGSPVYKASIDTTFALYNKRHFKKESFYDAVRVAGHYTCRHLPWYPSSGMSPTEQSFYKNHQKFSYYVR